MMRMVSKTESPANWALLGLMFAKPKLLGVTVDVGMRVEVFLDAEKLPLTEGHGGKPIRGPWTVIPILEDAEFG